MLSFKDYIKEAKIPPALKKKIDDIESGKLDKELGDLKTNAKKFDNKQILKAIEKREDARVEGKSSIKFNSWAKKFVDELRNKPELKDPADVAASAGLKFDVYEEYQKEIDKEIKKITSSRDIKSLMKTSG
jgi:hypothetical protein